MLTQKRTQHTGIWTEKHKIYNEAYLNEHFEHFQMGMYVNFPKVNAMLDKPSFIQ